MPQYHRPGGTVSYPDAKSLYPSVPRVSFGRAVAIGLSAGFLGALVMSGTNKLEQSLTQRPNSYVPARTMGNHLGVSASFYSRHTSLLNHLHHFGMGILAGPVRAIMSYYGVIGPFAAFVHTGVRMMMDQGVELAAGTSAVPWSWPINEQVVDLLHKGVYAVVVGYVCDWGVRGVDWFGRE